MNPLRAYKGRRVIIERAGVSYNGDITAVNRSYVTLESVQILDGNARTLEWVQVDGLVLIPTSKIDHVQVD